MNNFLYKFRKIENNSGNYDDLPSQYSFIRSIVTFLKELKLQNIFMKMSDNSFFRDLDYSYEISIII